MHIAHKIRCVGNTGRKNFLNFFSGKMKKLSWSAKEIDSGGGLDNMPGVQTGYTAPKL